MNVYDFVRIFCWYVDIIRWWFFMVWPSMPIWFLWSITLNRSRETFLFSRNCFGNLMELMEIQVAPNDPIIFGIMGGNYFISGKNRLFCWSRICRIIPGVWTIASVCGWDARNHWIFGILLANRMNKINGESKSLNDDHKMGEIRD